MADLTLTITEAVTLNGVSRGSTNTQTVTGVTQVFHRILDIRANTDHEVCSFGAAVGGDTFIDASVKHLRITNLDATNFVKLTLTETGVQEFMVKLEKGDSFILGNSVADANALGTGATPSYTNIDKISARSDTADCQIELFIAH